MTTQSARRTESEADRYWREKVDLTRNVVAGNLLVVFALAVVLLS